MRTAAGAAAPSPPSVTRALRAVARRLPSVGRRSRLSPALRATHVRTTGAEDDLALNAIQAERRAASGPSSPGRPALPRCRRPCGRLFSEPARPWRGTPPTGRAHVRVHARPLRGTDRHRHWRRTGIGRSTACGWPARGRVSSPPTSRGTGSTSWSPSTATSRWWRSRGTSPRRTPRPHSWRPRTAGPTSWSTTSGSWAAASSASAAEASVGAVGDRVLTPGADGFRLTWASLARHPPTHRWHPSRHRPAWPARRGRARSPP